MQTQSLDRGKIGEYICALRMLKDGIRCQIINFEATDIIAYHDDRLFRVQVKSSTLKNNGPSRNKGYQFNLAVGGKQKRHLTDADCDIIALVAIEHEQVMFFPRERLHGAKTKRILPNKFDDSNLCLKTWDRCLTYFSPIVP